MLKKLLERDFVFFDNANGWRILKRGLKPGQRPDIMNITAPGVVEEVLRESCDAGCDILNAITFGANGKTLRGTGFSVREIVYAAVDIAKRANAGRGLVAYDLGPIGEFIEPFGPLTFDESYELYREQAAAAEEAGAGLIAIETMSDLMELKAVILAIKENTRLPFFAMMTFDKSGRTFTGCRPESFAVTAQRLGAAAAGINCSLAPSEIYPIAEKIAASTTLPLIVKPNAGLPSSATGAYDIGPEEFARQLAPFADLGVKIVGGCCGTTPAYIKELRQTFETLKPAPFRRDDSRRICTPLQVESVEGYRFEPSRVRALNTTEEIVEDALDQADRGERILCVALPDGIPGEQASQAVRSIQGQSDRPLHLITGETGVLDAALRSVSGIAAVSSPGARTAAFDDVAAKYGAVIV